VAITLRSISEVEILSNILNSDKTLSNLASDLNPTCLTTRQKVPLNKKKIRRYLKMKQTIYLADNFHSRLRAKHNFDLEWLSESQTRAHRQIVDAG